VKLIVGLGNPGKRYERTRHNLGFLVVDRLTQQHRVEMRKRLCGALVGEWLNDGERIVLAKPQTFMNRSGLSVKGLLHEYCGTAEDLLVVYDDLDLPLGRIRIRAKGSAAGHRGILSILDNLDGAPFSRVRVGIGRPPEGVDPADYVLSPFDSEQAAELDKVVGRAAEAVDCFLRDGPQRAMELYNRAS
jgi:PTH1 family peptidyl-tRNA hydrolase